MLRKCPLIVVLLFTAGPLAAQEELLWSSKRPDAQAPFGVFAGRTLELSEVEFTYRFSQLNSVGIWFDDVPLSFEDLATVYTVVPLSLRNRTHGFGVSVGATEELTLSADLSVSQRRREHLRSDESEYFITDVTKLGDLELAGLYRVFDQGPYRAHIHVGARIPTGASDVMGVTGFSRPGEEPLPYDMRPGAGVFGFMPGLTALAQNESGTVGAQLRGTLFVGTNEQDWAPGDRMELNVWASARLNDYFSVSARVAHQTWAALNGADLRLNQIDMLFRDPGNQALFMGGSRTDIPVGLSLYMPQGSRLAGHRLSLEYVHPVSQKYDGPQFAADWGLVAGWQVVF